MDVFKGIRREVFMCSGFNRLLLLENSYVFGDNSACLNAYRNADERGRCHMKKNKSTWLFAAFLLLAGLLHATDPDQYHFLVTLMYCAEYLILAGLILFWMQSLNRRLLPTRAKRYLLATACLMLLFIAAQFTKFRIAVMPWLTRYCWYLYYIPMLLIPTLFLMTCIRLSRGTDRRKPDELLFLLPAGLIALGILTNDLHKMAFIPKGMIEELTGRSNTYTHGFLYYVSYAWIGCTVAAGIVFLILACRKRGSWKKAVCPLIILILIPVLLKVRGMIPKDSPLDFYEWPEIVIFCLLGVFEACIRSRLIPCNENYPGFFAQLDLPVMITDRQLNAVFQTKSPIQATEEQLKESLAKPVSPAPDIRLIGMEIRAGYAFRTEDEGAVNRLNEEIQDANEVLLQENEVLEREQELAVEQAGIEERSRLYKKAAQEVYPAQKKISEILENAQPGTASFRKDIEKALVLTAYVKRKANFVLVEAERKTISAKELASAMEESSHYLRYSGMNAAVDVTAERAFPCRRAMAIYDCFETAAEELLGKASDLFVRLRDDELLIMAETGEISDLSVHGTDGRPVSEALPDLSGVPLPVRWTCEDGQLVLRFDIDKSAKDLEDVDFSGYSGILTGEGTAV